MNSKQVILGSILLSAISVTASVVAEPLFIIDSEASSLSFNVKATVEDVEGRFEKVEVESIEYYGLPESLKGRLIISINSLDTGKEKRDIHLKSADFFDVANYPKAFIDIISITQEEGQYYARFMVEIRGIRKEFTAPIELKTSWLKIEATGTITLKRTDFDIKGNILTNTIINDDVLIDYKLVLVRQKSSVPQ
ncbi:MAG: YceI family protein [Leptonema sp. (in: Bacteria)]|nr:YceI family protein [Leptonema sp. (in: bacteria)]